MKTRKNWAGNIDRGASSKGSYGVIKTLEKNFEKFYSHYRNLGTELTAMRKEITRVAKRAPVAQ